MPLLLKRSIYFGSFLVNPQVFYVTSLSFALVNLKPLLPGHILVSPLRVVPRFTELSADEVSDLFLTVQRVSRMLERLFKASALNIAIQDGEDAGQTVKHVHAHIIPRTKADMDHVGGSDAIYDVLESERGDIGQHQRDHEKSSGNRRLTVDDQSRTPRNAEEMRKEAEWLTEEMERDIPNGY